jgi:CDP-diglyceride synthetase
VDLVRNRRIAEAVGALAGVVLVVLVFWPWWVFDPASAEAALDPPQLAPDFDRAGALGAINLYATPDVSAWDGLRNGALIWIVTGGLGVALALTSRLGLAARALQGLRIAVLGAALVSLAIAVVRLADPPFAAYQPAVAAYAGTLAIAAIAICAAVGIFTASGLRRT